VWKKLLIRNTFPVILLIISMIPASSQGLVQKLVPHHYKLQFAGGIGFLSAGVGYHSRSDKTDYDLYYGYVPPSAGGVRIHTLSGKFTWAPLPVARINKTSIKPLTCGLLVNYSFGKQYFGFSPEKYPFGYYGFPTSLHLGAYLGGALDHRFVKNHSQRKIGLYYEFVTYDVELLSYMNNHGSLGITDVVSLAIGVRYGVGN